MTPEYKLAVDINDAEAIELQKKGFQVAEKLPPSTISNQLRDELVRILKDGDTSSSGAFTVAVAARVEKFVVAAREILMTEKLAQNDIAALLAMKKRRRQQLGYGGPMIAPYGDDLLGEDYGMGMVAPIPNENFGVQAIKQMIEAARSMSDSPVKLVEALASARQLGLHDVAAGIEKKLGVEKPTIEAVPTPVTEGGAA